MGSTDAYEVIENIGKGTFGTVSKVRRKHDAKVLVWKEMDYGKMGEKEKQQLVQEVNLLQKLRHPNIVRYYDRIIDRENTTLFIVMEHCEGGDIASLIKKCRKERTYIDEEVIWKTFMQILLALSECHKKSDGVILHRDIKPGNIFLDGEKNVKLGDFGLARVLGENSLFAHTYVGTPFYMSPEQICGCAYNEKCDIWSLGCLIYEMAALYPPFEAANQYLLSKKIKEGKFARVPKNYSDDLQKIIERMLNINRQKRADIDEIMAFPQIAIRLRERKINQHYNTLKKKEDDLRKKESELDDRERQLNAREQMLLVRETDQGARFLDPAVGRLVEMGRAALRASAEVDTLADTLVDFSMSSGMEFEKENAMMIEPSKGREVPVRISGGITHVQPFRDVDHNVAVRRAHAGEV